MPYGASGVRNEHKRTQEQVDDNRSSDQLPLTRGICDRIRDDEQDAGKGFKFLETRAGIGRSKQKSRNVKPWEYTWDEVLCNPGAALVRSRVQHCFFRYCLLRCCASLHSENIDGGLYTAKRAGDVLVSGTGDSQPGGATQPAIEG
jgi:hypothetical protein